MTERPELPCPIAGYVPQRGPLCLLDKLLTVDEASLVASVRPGDNTLFVNEAGVPGWVGVEWLAQAVAAWAGWHAAAHGDAPAVGFLVGTRHYRCRATAFAADGSLAVHVTRDFVADNGLARFRGEIRDGDDLLAEGNLTIYQPAAEDAPRHA
ncbi:MULTISPECIES: hypothetical protein [unclassified Modicisalibacter]|uniref:ApeP family dehydratase n=1 Tax=unclassified Modicisalibacter TaxID=2679913 RepID=UPI001CCB33CA|nr:MULTISPECIES: hypothetical protein [unclassified Modicisalibacter]MBZ9559928.1 hypothetical protein [Modicisalibacter sp. R2A 31.J]MBZ9575836.1 hypothetical protein [Modicisalibacter sp. MOD 31.J]